MWTKNKAETSQYLLKILQAWFQSSVRKVVLTLLLWSIPVASSILEKKRHALAHEE